MPPSSHDPASGEAEGDSPHLRFGGWKKTASPPVSPGRPTAALPAMSGPQSAFLHRPFLSREEDGPAPFAAKAPGAPRFGGIGLARQAQAMPPLVLEVPQQQQPAPQPSTSARPAPEPRPAPTRQAVAPPIKRKSSRRTASPRTGGPPVDRQIEKEVEEVLKKIPDDPALVRAMLADVLIRAQQSSHQTVPLIAPRPIPAPVQPSDARRSSASSAASSRTGSRRGSVRPPPTPPPTSPLPPAPFGPASIPTIDEDVPPRPSSTGLQPRAGALPLFRQNLDLAGPAPDETKREEREDSPVVTFDPFGEAHQLDDGPDLWTQMESLGLASRLRSSVAGATEEGLASTDAEEAARNRSDVDLLARISLLRADRDRPPSAASNADSFATAASDSKQADPKPDPAPFIDDVESDYGDEEPVRSEDDGIVNVEEEEEEEGEVVFRPESWDLGTLAQDIDQTLVPATSDAPAAPASEAASDDRARSEPPTRSGSSSGGTGNDSLDPPTPPEAHQATFSDLGAAGREAVGWGAAGSPAMSAPAPVDVVFATSAPPPPPASVVAAGKRVRPDSMIVDHFDVGDGLVAIPRRRSPSPTGPLVGDDEPVSAGRTMIPPPPFQLLRRPRIVTEQSPSSVQDAATTDSGPPSSGSTVSKRSSVNVADLKAALSTTGASSSTTTAPPASSPELAAGGGPASWTAATAPGLSVRTQRSFLPPPVRLPASPTEANKPDRPEPILEEPESEEGEEVEPVAQKVEPAAVERDVKGRSESESEAEARSLTTGIGKGPAQQPSYVQAPTASWGFGGIGGLASGLVKMGSAAWEWGLSSTGTTDEDDEEDADRSLADGAARMSLAVPGEFLGPPTTAEVVVVPNPSGGGERADARLTASGRSTPDEDELMEEWKEVIPPGVDPVAFVAEVREAMRSAKADPDADKPAAFVAFTDQPSMTDEPGDEEGGAGGVVVRPVSPETYAEMVEQAEATASPGGGEQSAASRRRRRASKRGAPEMPVIPQRSVSSSTVTGGGNDKLGQLPRRVASVSTVSSSTSPLDDGGSFLSRSTSASMGGKKRKSLKGLFARKSADPVAAAGSREGTPGGKAASTGSAGSSSDLRSNSLMSSVLGASAKPKLSTTQQIESALQDMTYVSYDTGPRRERSRSLDIDAAGTSPTSEPGDFEPAGAEARPRRSSLKRQSRYDDRGRKRSLTPADSIPEEDEKAIYGVRFANATRGLGLRSVAEDEAALAGGDHHALRWIGVGRGRYGELQLMENDMGDEIYAEQVKQIRAKWRSFGRNVATDWSKVKID